MEKNKTYLEEREEIKIPVTLSTQEPVMMGDGVEEVLVLNNDSVRLHTAELPLCMHHDITQQVGKTTDIQIVDGRLTANAVFGSSQQARQVMKDVMDGIVQNVSIGYKVLESYINDLGQRIATEIEIFESSVVGVGADGNAGFYRDYSTRNATIGNFKMELTRKEKAEITKARETALEEASEIRDLASLHNLSEMGDEAIRNKMPLAEFRNKLLESIASKPLDTPSLHREAVSLRSAPYFNEKNYSETYSISNAIRGCIEPRFRGLEAEISQDLQRNQDLKSEHGIIIPTDQVINTRSMTVGNLGGNVSDISDSTKLIPFVQRKGIYGDIGLSIFNNFASDVKIPKGTSSATTEFLNLDGTDSIDEGTPTMSSVAFSPKSLGCFTQITHKLALQSSVDMDSYLRNLMGESIANQLDLAVIHGSGSSNQPTGMLNATGINTETYTSAIAYADLANALSTLATDSIPLNALSWVVNPAEYASLQVKDKGTDTGQFLLETGADANRPNQVGTMLGYPCFVSEHVPAGEVLLVRAQHSALAFFGGLEVDVDPYFDFQKGNVGIRAIQDFDFNVLNANSICKIST